MINFARLYDEKQAMIVHAIATNYRERSHFDGQDVLESGRLAPGRTESGWLNRAVAALPKGERVGARGALAVGYTAPLVMRGPAPILGWAPSGLTPPTEDLAGRLMNLYAHADPALAKALQAGLDADRMANRQGMDALKPGGDIALQMKKAAIGAARLMNADDGPRIGALAVDGWDTHANEGGATDASRNCWAVSTPSSPRSRVSSDRAGRRRSSSRSLNSAAPPASTARSARTTEPARSPSSRGARWRADA